MKSKVMSFEFNILNAIFLAIAYIVIGLVIPTALNLMLWRPYTGNFSAWINIVTLIVISIMFFIAIARITGHKVAIFNNITITGMLLAIGCSALFFLLLDNFLDPIIEKMFPVSEAEFQEMLAAMRQLKRILCFVVFWHMLCIIRFLILMN